MFASHTTETVPVPGDPEHSVLIRRLSALQLEAAARQSQIAASKRLVEIGGAAALKEINALGGDQAVAEAAAEELKRDPTQGYDRRMVLLAGIVSWTYDRTVTPEAIDDIEPEAADVLNRAILKLTRPSLFQTEEETKAETKNG